MRLHASLAAELLTPEIDPNHRINGWASVVIWRIVPDQMVADVYKAAGAGYAVSLHKSAGGCSKEKV